MPQFRVTYTAHPRRNIHENAYVCALNATRVRIVELSDRYRGGYSKNCEKLREKLVTFYIS